MTPDQIWNCETPTADILGITVPAWIDQDISPADIIAICQGGCASGAYMPAVTYYQALRTMSEHGDDVLAYIDDALGEGLAPEPGDSWGGIACRYLSCAVELWAGSVLAMLEDHEPETDDTQEDA